jgi:hypothetical protein
MLHLMMACQLPVVINVQKIKPVILNKLAQALTLLVFTWKGSGSNFVLDPDYPDRNFFVVISS